MAGVKISALPSVGSPALTDIMPEVQPALGGITYKVSFTQLLALFQSNIQITESQVTNLVTDLDGKVAVAGDTMTGFLILNADPLLPLGAATKQYVDNVASGLIILLAVYAASTANLTAIYNNGVAGVGATLTNSGGLSAFSIDGVNPPLNARILVKDQTTTFQNGIYTLTTIGSGAIAWVLTRATDYDTPAEINPGDLASVNNGTVNSATAWLETATVTTIGVDPILFSKFGGVVLPLAMSQGGTGAVLTPSNGGIVWTNATTMQVLAGTATARQMLQSGATSTPAWSTSTWPDTTTINQILYSSAGNTVTGLPTANNATLQTNASGVPSWVAGTSFKTIKSQEFTVNGTYTPSSGMLACIVECIGGGGAGGGSTSAAGQTAGGGGGGGGAYARSVLTAADIGVSQAITIGAGGTVGAAGANPGNAGGSTSLGALVIALGGSGGGGAASTGGGAAGIGGLAGGSTFNQASKGGDAGGVGNGASIITVGTIGGFGGSSFYGAGAAGISRVGGGTQIGNTGANHGGGGGGGVSVNAGGNITGGPGAGGKIIITEYCSV